MSYASIMVHIEWDGEVDARAQLAAKLADTFHAKLIGITAWKPRRRSVLDADIAAREGDYLATESQRLGAQFQSTLSVDGRKIELRSCRDFPTESLRREMRAADLLIMGRDYGVSDNYLYPDPGAVVLGAGRPVLMVPPGVQNLAGRRVVVAWKDTREARRALHDALPFLRKAEQVLVAEFCERSSEVTDSQNRLRDVLRYLARHDISHASDHVRPAEACAVNAMLQLAQDHSADLIVAGAYGHSRIGELIFGGVTQELLARSPVCCLLSH